MTCAKTVTVHYKLLINSSSASPYMLHDTREVHCVCPFSSMQQQEKPQLVSHIVFHCCSHYYLDFNSLKIFENDGQSTTKTFQHVSKGQGESYSP